VCRRTHRGAPIPSRAVGYGSREYHGPALQGSQGSRSPKQWEPGPSAIALGMMDSVLTMEKLLSDRVPPDSHARLGRRLTSLRRSVLHAIVGHDRFLHNPSLCGALPTWAFGQQNP
jgi:hypothetical protein